MVWDKVVAVDVVWAEVEQEINERRKIMKRCTRCIIQSPITIPLETQTHCPICGEELVDMSQFETEEETDAG